MGNRRYEVSRRGWGQRLALAGLAATVIACGGAEKKPEETPNPDLTSLAACSYTITANSYVGSPDYWGTITFRNTGTTAMTRPTIAFGVPSGVKCDYDEPGWTHTQSGTVCTYSRSSNLTVAASSSYTFNYSTDSSASFTATNVQITDPSCGTTGGSDGGTNGGSDGGSDGGTNGGSDGGTNGGNDGGTNGGSDGGTPTTGLSPNQKKVAEALTSIWENDTPTLDYAYSENINDGRGYTNGRAGFCTGTGDAIMVIQCYVNVRSAANGNLMAKYMPGLTTINDRFNSTGQDQASTAELDAVGTWTADWAASYNNTTTRADFKSCQDQISDQLYYTPAMTTAAKWGLTQALTKAELYDAFINHGEDGAKAMIKATNTALGDSAQVAPVIGYNGITENAWLQKFLEKRRDTLAADSTWIDAIDRVATYEKLRRLGNWDFSTAVKNDVRARDCWTTTYPSSGYTVRLINPDGTWSTPASSTYSCN